MDVTATLSLGDPLEPARKATAEMLQTRERTYSLPQVKAGERVEVRFLLPVASRAAAPEWSDILLGVEATRGKVKRGDPGSVTLGRIFYRMFGW